MKANEFPLNCPFCGLLATVVPSAVGESSVECRNTECQVRPVCREVSVLKSIEGWNMRGGCKPGSPAYSQFIRSVDEVKWAPC